MRRYNSFVGAFVLLFILTFPVLIALTIWRSYPNVNVVANTSDIILWICMVLVVGIDMRVDFVMRMTVDKFGERSRDWLHKLMVFLLIVSLFTFSL